MSKLLKAVLVGLTVAACITPWLGSATALGASKVREVHWGVAKGPDKQGVRIMSGTGYCEGDRRPYFSSIKVEERKNATIIRAFLKKFSHPRYLCVGSIIFTYHYVRLSPRAAGLPLYDGSTTPPTRRWPIEPPAERAKASGICAKVSRILLSLLLGAGQ
jgi:hypothetical protein